MNPRPSTDSTGTTARGVALAGVLALAACLAAAPAAAQESGAWSGTLGLSFVATSGNSDTTTFGLDLGLERKPNPWGWTLAASYLKAEQDGETTAERYGASLRADRKLGDRWSLFGSLAADHDAFAGYDLRGIAAAGGTYHAMLGPVHELAFDAGLTWTTEHLIADRDRDFMGGVFGLTYAWHPRKGTTLGEHLVWYPDFDESSDWRLTSETSVQAALSDRLALKVGYLVRYDHQPVPGFDETDTTTTISLVVGF